MGRAAAGFAVAQSGDGTFEDVTRQAGIDEPGSGFHVTWFDYNRDGWLDIYVSNGVTLDRNINHLYRNNGNGTFTNVTREAGLEEEQRAGTIGIAVGDYDQDGWPDLFVHGRMRPNRCPHPIEEVARPGDVPAGRGTCPVGGHGQRRRPDIVTVSLALGTRSYRAPWDHVPGPRSDSSAIPQWRGPHYSDVVAAGSIPLPGSWRQRRSDNDGYWIFFRTGNPDLRQSPTSLPEQRQGNFRGPVPIGGGLVAGKRPRHHVRGLER